MQSERWQRCTEIFNIAVEHSGAERATLLERRCNGDAGLRRGVELLLKYHDESGDFIERPAFAAAPELVFGEPEALVGQRLGCYRIDAVLGVGGMGVVYLAYDERLERKLALKLLRSFLVANPAQLEGLKREARTASALNHPNIVTIHEIGEVDSTHFIATEFIEGTTLRQRMSQGPIAPDETLDIAIQVTSALAVAHRAGIVHRDIKPENIMLRPDGYVKVLDFGIAKLMQPQLSPDAELADRAAIIGTTRYMSPEQAQGQRVDARTDIWSLGAVLYEMLAGKAAFDGKTPADVLNAIQCDETKALPSSPLQRVVVRALRKDPAQRYATAEDLASDLRKIKAAAHRAPLRPHSIAIGAAVLLLASAAFLTWRSGHARNAGALPPNDKSIAVLPFENLSPEADNAFLADGIQDDVVTGLARIKDLKVIARNSVADYRGANARGKLREIGTSLGVAHLVQGSVRRSGDHIVVNVSLVDARTQQQKWAQHYERSMADALRLQGELAMDIARQLRATLTPTEATSAAGKPTQNAQAYLLYLRARESDLRSEIDGDVKELNAIELYQQALDLDPSFALARARLSMCASRLVYKGLAGDWKRKARAEAEEALRLRPDLGEAWLALTHSYLWGDENYARALAELDHAAELLPNSPEVPVTAAYIYKRQNRFRERIAALHRAEALDPRNLRALQLLTNTLRWVRDWPEAMQSFDRYQAILPPQLVCPSRGRRAHDEFCATGDINVLKNVIAREAVAGLPVDQDWLNFARYEVAMLERNYAAAAGFLAAIPAESSGRHYDFMGGRSRAFNEAMLVAANNVGSKQQALQIAREEAESRLAPDARSPNKPWSDVAVLDALLGRKAQAIGEAERGIEAWPVPGSPERNDASAALALVYAQTGEADKAIDLIEHLLTVPVGFQLGAVYNMTLTDLRWCWQWDPLRSHPRFQKLLAAAEPKTVY